MPTENERKYVLRDPQAVLELWPRETWSEIRQAYLRGDARIRRRSGEADSFTYKIAAGEEGRGRLIEIETALEARDFDDLWPLATRRIHKLRRTETDAAGHQWDVDVFFDEEGALYLAMAECELPEGVEAPEAVLPALQSHVRYPVPRSRQTEFANTRLSDPAYVRALRIED
jgi:CYTH domain-containing protein